MHAVVARSTFQSQDVQSTPASEHFWKLRCSRSARRCDAKHMSKSKCTKHLTFKTLLEVEMFKKRTWVAARSTCPSQKRQKIDGYGALFDFQTFCVHLVNNEQNVRIGSSFNENNHYTTQYNTTLHSTSLRYTSLNYTTLHYTTLHYTTLTTTRTPTTTALATTTTLHYVTLC